MVHGGEKQPTSDQNVIDVREFKLHIGERQLIGYQNVINFGGSQNFTWVKKERKVIIMLVDF
jgi:hypothetical protein